MTPYWQVLEIGAMKVYHVVHHMAFKMTEVQFCLVISKAIGLFGSQQVGCSRKMMPTYTLGWHAVWKISLQPGPPEPINRSQSFDPNHFPKRYSQQYPCSAIHVCQGETCHIILQYSQLLQETNIWCQQCYRRRVFSP